MLFGSDGLANFYLGCFLFGLIFTVVSLFLSAGHFGGADAHAHGGGFHPGDAHGHVLHHIGNGHHADAHVHQGSGEHEGGGNGAIGWLNLPTILAFITWFGGAGYLIRQSAGMAELVSFIGAVLLGWIGASIMFFLLARVLWPGQGQPLSRAEYQMRGTPGRVVSRIGANGGTGEVVYVKGGARTTIGARSENGDAIEQGTEIVITRYERGLAYVLNVSAVLGQNVHAELPPERPTLPLSELSPPPAEKVRRDV